MAEEEPLLLLRAGTKSVKRLLSIIVCLLAVECFLLLLMLIFVALPTSYPPALDDINNNVFTIRQKFVFFYSDFQSLEKALYNYIFNTTK